MSKTYPLRKMPEFVNNKWTGILMKVFKICSFILFYFLARMAFTDHTETSENIINKSEIHLPQSEKWTS